jgi:Anti-sigma-K factor rskA
VNREPTLDELIGADTTGAERQRLQHVHELLLEAGPPPELTPELEAGPKLKMTVGKRRRVVKQRAMLLLAAAVALSLIFLGGYAVGNNRGSSKSTPAVSLELTGTSAPPTAQASLEVWHGRAGNWPMTLTAVGLPKLAPHNYYEVYLIRDGRLSGSCGTFRVTNPKRAVTVTLNSPYTLQKGDSWIVTRPGPGGVEPGKTVLRPVTA